jgi:hypothetical protein
MAERNRWHFIPTTAPLCWLYAGVGAVLLVSSIVSLTTTDAKAPVLTVIAGVAALALLVVAGVGLARPSLRGR